MTNLITRISDVVTAIGGDIKALYAGKATIAQADVAANTNAATSKATPVDADLIPIIDSAASFSLKKLTWANLKVTLKTYFDTLYATASALSSHVSGGNAHGAGSITNIASGNLSATNVQSALYELQSDVDTRVQSSALAGYATNATVNSHLSGVANRHNAYEIENTASGNLTSTTVGEALNELQSDVDTRALNSALTTTNTNLSDHITDTDEAHNASAIRNVPSGNLAANNVQAALNELQSDIDTREKSINAASSKVTPVDADTFGVIDSAASSALKKVTWANLKAALKTYFDGIYATITSLNLKADIASPTFTGVPSAPTATAGTDTTQIASTEFVQAELSAKQSTSAKDATGGYVGLTQFKINFKNALNTFTSFFTNANTASRTYIFPDKDGIVAMMSDVPPSGIFDLTVDTASLPPSDTVRLFKRSVGNRQMPAFVGPSGLDSSLQPLIARNKVAWFNPPGNATTVSSVGITLTATGTATAANVATTNIHTAVRRLEYAVTTAAATAIAGWRSAFAQYHIGAQATPFGGFFMIVRFGRSRGAAANATLRGFTGFSSLTTAPTDANPSTSETNAIGVGCDATDTNYQIIHRAGSATATKIDTGIPKSVADTTELYELALFCAPQAAGVGYEFSRLSDGVKFSGVITTNLPADSQLLAPRGYYSAGGTSSVMGYALASAYIETDY